jgi:hypothetical protein
MGILSLLTSLVVFQMAAIATLAIAGEPPNPQALTPLTNGHAHNDYAHARPLVEALENGFCSIEADVFASEGKLLVGHDARQLDPSRTLQSLYLDPLRRQVKKNNGRVYANGPTVILLIDLKTRPGRTYSLLRKVLAEYVDILTVERHGKVEQRALQAILSGYSPRKELTEDPIRYAALDGREGDLDSKESTQLIPLVSMSWAGLFQWRGEGDFPPDEKAKLRGMVARAHASHRRIRFWATPDRPNFWRELQSAGVDLINVDDLAGLRAFLLKAADGKGS